MSALFLLFFAVQASAASVDEYQKRVQQAVNALDTLTQVDEEEIEEAVALRSAETLAGVRIVLPPTEEIEWQGQTLDVDNTWLHQEIEQYEKAGDDAKGHLLVQIIERLRALEERLAETKGEGTTVSLDKLESNKKLAEILGRPEYARKPETESALNRLLNQLLDWFKSLFPQPAPIKPGRESLFTQFLQLFVILLALGVIIYAVKMFATHNLRNRRSKKKSRREPRVVLGERLEPDQSSIDLLAEAEALARRGELRTAIRKAYIALLVELGERKLIRLEHHKTNRDYLSALDGQQQLYEAVKQLTESFEVHWYGFTRATEEDWRAFRTAYTRAVRS